MNWCVDQQVLPLGIRQSGRDSAIDLVHHVIKGCQYGAFRLVVWVHALLDKFRVDFIQQIVLHRHKGATTVLNPLGMRNSSLESMGSLPSPTLRRVSENPLAFSSFPIRSLSYSCVAGGSATEARAWTPCGRRSTRRPVCPFL